MPLTKLLRSLLCNIDLEKSHLGAKYVPCMHLLSLAAQQANP